MKIPDDFEAVAMDKSVAELQHHYRAAYNTVLAWLHSLSPDVLDARRANVPLGRSNRQRTVSLDDMASINVSDRTTYAAAKQGSDALKAAIDKMLYNRAQRIIAGQRP